jgi:ABC-type uncharacterized transport system substrate-binding protein
MRARLATFLLLIALGAGLPLPPAQSHPHVWIIATATLVFEDGRITKIRHQWLFDEIFSANIIHDFDRNKDGRFDAKETREIEANAFGNLGEYDFFTHMAVAGATVPFKKARDFSIERRRDRVLYHFTLDLPAPVDPLKQGVQLAVFDETYFVEVLLAEIDPVRFEGAAGIACQAKIGRNESLASAFGVGVLERIDLTCGSGG